MKCGITGGRCKHADEYDWRGRCVHGHDRRRAGEGAAMTWRGLVCLPIIAAMALGFMLFGCRGHEEG
jgi:hypothetical protein